MTRKKKDKSLRKVHEAFKDERVALLARGVSEHAFNDTIAEMRRIMPEKKGSKLAIQHLFVIFNTLIAYRLPATKAAADTNAKTRLNHALEVLLNGDNKTVPGLHGIHDHQGLVERKVSMAHEVPPPANGVLPKHEKLKRRKKNPQSQELKASIQAFNIALAGKAPVVALAPRNIVQATPPRFMKRPSGRPLKGDSPR